MIDLHCHVDLYPEPGRIAQRCAEEGLYVLSVTTTPSAWSGTSALEQGHIRTALGLHPQLARERKGELRMFDDLLPHVRYVGEIGLDGSPEFRSSWQDQLKVFDHILRACAKAGGRVMSIHSRRASRAVLDCLQANPNSGAPILHWFSGSYSDLDQAVAMGCWFSVGPAMLTAAKGRALVARMPPDRILPESDGPFAQLKGAPVYPWDTRLVTKMLSGLWRTELEVVDRRLMQNLSDLVGDHGF